MPSKWADALQVLAIVGAGTMGRGIALAALQAGLQVQVYDEQPRAAEEAEAYIGQRLTELASKGKLTAPATHYLARFQRISRLADLKATLVIEAIVEDLQAKVDLFRRLARINHPETIFCTNTSSIPVTQIAEQIPNPSRVAGMHFFNPADRIRLVEVVATAFTAAEVLAQVCALAHRMDKVPITVKDVPGFLVNRIGKLYHTEPLQLLEQQVASVAVVDELLEASGFRMGPFRLIDLIGVDANLNVTRSLYAQLGAERFRPSALQERMVQQGLLGRKRGKGFYDYPDKNPSA